MEDLPTELITKVLGLLNPCDWFGVLVASKRLLEVGRWVFDPTTNEHFYLRKSAEKGYVHAVRYLIKDFACESTVKNNAPLRLACENGHVEVVRELLKDEKVVFKMNQESWCYVYCLHYAQRNNHTKVVKELLNYYAQYGKSPKTTPKKKKKAKPSKKLLSNSCELSRSL